MVVFFLVFGVFYIGGGWSVVFGVWVSVVGAVYGVAALYTYSVVASAAAYALVNIVLVVYWNVMCVEKVIGEKKWEGED